MHIDCILLQLSKHRLTALITSTALGGVLVSPAPLSLPVLGTCIVGTALISVSIKGIESVTTDLCQS